MKSFLKYIMFSLAIFSHCTLFAQSGTTEDDEAKNMNILLSAPNGSIFLPGRYSSITSGSAFYKEEFLPATIYFTSNKAAKSTKVRLDLLENEIHFLDDKQVEFIITEAAEKIIFDLPDNTRELFIPGKTLPTDNSKYKNQWFQVLQQNEMTIYKLYKKAIVEYKPFNSGVVEKSIETYEKYFIIKDGILVESKKAKPARKN